MPLPDGNAAVIAAGTGLGEAMLHNVDGRFIPAASEGGHADFAARTPREMEMVAEADADLRPRRRRARHLGPRPREHLPVHPRLLRIGTNDHAQQPRAGAAVRRVSERSKDPSDLPARISQAAMERRCDALRRGVRHLSSPPTAPRPATSACARVATAGVYIGGGIAPKILPALESGLFMDAFRDKEPMAHLVATMPVSVILNPDAGLLGAAVHAQFLVLSN